MANQFILSDEILKILLTSYISWLDKNNVEKNYTEKFKKRDEALRATLLDKKYLSSATEDDLSKEIFKYTRTLEGPAFIRLGAPRIKNESKNIKRNLLYFIDSNDELFKKAEKIITGEYRIKIFAVSFWTPLFQVFQPDLLPNWNNKTSKFFRKVGVEAKNRKESFAERYKAISAGFVYLRSLDQRHDLYSINHLMHYATSVEEGVNLLDRLSGKFAPVGEPSFWWVCQGTSYTSERGKQFLWAPHKDKGGKTHPHWASIERVKKGDIIFNYANNALQGLSIAKAPGFEFINEDPQWEKEGIKVDIDHYELSKVSLLLIKARFEEFKEALKDVPNQPFDMNGDVKQDYLFDFNYEAAKIIRSIYGKPFPDAIEKYFPQKPKSDATAPYKESLLMKKKQIILYGPPGTGKTFNTKRMAVELLQWKK